MVDFRNQTMSVIHKCQYNDFYTPKDQMFVINDTQNLNFELLVLQYKNDVSTVKHLVLKDECRDYFKVLQDI